MYYSDEELWEYAKQQKMDPFGHRYDSDSDYKTFPIVESIHQFVLQNLLNLLYSMDQNPQKIGQLVLVIGMIGSGKTALIKRVMQKVQEQQPAIPLYIVPFKYPESAFRHLVREMMTKLLEREQNQQSPLENFVYELYKKYSSLPEFPTQQDMLENTKNWQTYLELENIPEIQEKIKINISCNYLPADILDMILALIYPEKYRDIHSWFTGRGISRKTLESIVDDFIGRNYSHMFSEDVDDHAAEERAISILKGLGQLFFHYKTLILCFDQIENYLDLDKTEEKRTHFAEILKTIVTENVVNIIGIIVARQDKYEKTLLPYLRSDVKDRIHGIKDNRNEQYTLLPCTKEQGLQLIDSRLQFLFQDLTEKQRKFFSPFHQDEEPWIQFWKHEETPRIILEKASEYFKKKIGLDTLSKEDFFAEYIQSLQKKYKATYIDQNTDEFEEKAEHILFDQWQDGIYHFLNSPTVQKNLNIQDMQTDFYQAGKCKLNFTMQDQKIGLLLLSAKRCQGKGMTSPLDNVLSDFKQKNITKSLNLRPQGWSNIGEIAKEKCLELKTYGSIFQQETQKSVEEWGFVSYILNDLTNEEPTWFQENGQEIAITHEEYFQYIIDLQKLNMFLNPFLHFRQTLDNLLSLNTSNTLNITSENISEITSESALETTIYTTPKNMSDVMPEKKVKKKAQPKTKAQLELPKKKDYSVTDIINMFHQETDCQNKTKESFKNESDICDLGTLIHDIISEFLLRCSEDHAFHQLLQSATCSIEKINEHIYTQYFLMIRENIANSKKQILRNAIFQFATWFYDSFCDVIKKSHDIKNTLQSIFIGTEETLIAKLNLNQNLIGRYDALICNPHTQQYHIIDFKVMSYKENNIQHIQQISLYAWLIKKCKNILIQSGSILYLGSTYGIRHVSVEEIDENLRILECQIFSENIGLENVFTQSETKNNVQSEITNQDTTFEIDDDIALEIDDDIEFEIDDDIALTPETKAQLESQEKKDYSVIDIINMFHQETDCQNETKESSQNESEVCDLGTFIHDIISEFLLRCSEDHVFQQLLQSATCSIEKINEHIYTQYFLMIRENIANSKKQILRNAIFQFATWFYDSFWDMIKESHDIKNTLQSIFIGTEETLTAELKLNQNLIGRYDALIYNPHTEQYHIIDFKVMSYKENNIQHIQQISLYAWLVKKCKNILIQSGSILYLGSTYGIRHVSVEEINENLRTLECQMFSENIELENIFTQLETIDNDTIIKIDNYIDNDTIIKIDNDSTFKIDNDSTFKIGNDITFKIGNDITFKIGNDITSTIDNDITFTIDNAQLETTNDAQSEIIDNAQLETTNDAQSEIIDNAQLETTNDAQSEIIDNAQLETTEISIELGIDKLNQPVVWNPSQLQNGHILCVGKTGSGKSHTIIHFVTELIKYNIPILIFDVQDEFTRIDYLKQSATIIDCNETYLQFNPLIPKIKEDGTRQNYIACIYQFLDCLNPPYFGENQKSCLRCTLEEAFENHGFQKEDKSTWNNKVPKLQEVFEILQTKKKGQEILNKNYFYTLFNLPILQGEDLSLETLFKESHILSFAKDSEEMYVPVTQLILRYIYSHMKQQMSNEIRLVCIFDEAHTLLGHRALNRTLIRLAKESRKYGLVLVFASQQMKDFDDAIISNIDTLISLTLDGDYAIRMTNAFSVYDQVNKKQLAEYISTLNTGEAIIRNNMYKPYVFAKLH